MQRAQRGVHQGWQVRSCGPVFDQRRQHRCNYRGLQDKRATDEHHDVLLLFKTGGHIAHHRLPSPQYYLTIILTFRLLPSFRLILLRRPPGFLRLLSLLSRLLPDLRLLRSIFHTDLRGQLAPALLFR